MDHTQCGSCGAQAGATAKFCSECGAPLTPVAQPAEYKQVTVSFADVVHSMDIARLVGAERLREIMAQLVKCVNSVIQRYGGTVGSFTGDGVMAIFGAPTALEDHAIRACLAALAIQEEAKQLAVEVQTRDDVELLLRVGLNSGQVIAGEIASGPFGYTTIGEHVGMAQRMESVAPPGGVMLSASTARLVDGVAALGEPEVVRIKGSDEPVPARQLLGMNQHRGVKRAESNLVGRRWEISAVAGLLDRAVDGHGGVVGVVGPPGIGKSRLVREVAATAAQRGVEVFTAFCESHTSQVPFQVVTRLMRAATGVEGLESEAARAIVRNQFSDAEAEESLLFEDLLGIGDPSASAPRIDPDARRRRLTAMVNAASLATETTAVYVVEDAHWIDEVSESMLTDFLTVVPQTPLLTLVTYRPEYRGALAQVPGAQTIALAPLSDSETAALVSGLLGPDPSVVGLGQMIADRASGTPFFAEEIVRDLADRGVLQGNPGAYMSTAEAAEAIGQVLRDGGLDVDVRSVKEAPDISGYNALVLGSAVWAGKPLPEATRFVTAQRDALARLPVAYFVLCDTLKEDTPENRERARGFVDPLVAVQAPVSVGLFAGARRFGKLYPLLRWLLKHVMRLAEGDWRDWDQIRAWAADLPVHLTREALVGTSAA